MSGEFEAAGAMATAGLAASAIEGREAHGAGEGACLNCGATLAGAYCAQCGQAAHPHRSLSHVFEEFLHGVIHFDTKAWRTLPMVAFRPGTLTRNYVYGKRARYISPLALFLFTIFFMFAVFAFAGGGSAPINITETGTVAEHTEALEQARVDLTTAREALAELEASGEDIPGTPGLAVRLARDGVLRAEQEVRLREGAVTRAQAREAAGVENAGRSTDPSEPVVITEGGLVEIETDDSTLTWQEISRQIAESDDFVVIHGWDSFNHKARDKLRNPDLSLYKIQQAAYKFSFLLIPISLPFIALLFLWKRGVTLYDHVVFSLYSLSFVSLLFVAIVLSSQVVWLAWVTPVALLVGLPVHTYFHLKGAYALGWFSALWRTFFMLTFALIALTIFLIAIIILGLAG